MLNKLLRRQDKSFSNGSPFQLSTATETIHQLEKQLTHTKSELAAAEEKNKELTEKLAQLSTEQRDATKRHTLRFEILRDMLGLELLKNTDPANLAVAADTMKIALDNVPSDKAAAG